jgi:hypothetical protein
MCGSTPVPVSVFGALLQRRWHLLHIIADYIEKKISNFCKNISRSNKTSVIYQSRYYVVTDAEIILQEAAGGLYHPLLKILF